MTYVEIKVLEKKLAEFLLGNMPLTKENLQLFSSQKSFFSCFKFSRQSGKNLYEIFFRIILLIKLLVTFYPFNNFKEDKRVK